MAELEDDPGQGAPPGTGGSLPWQHGGGWGEPHAQSQGRALFGAQQSKRE